MRSMWSALGGIEMPDIKILSERCVDCGDCVLLCPQSGDGVADPVLAAEGGAVFVVNVEGCMGCFTCVESCRAAAIVISDSSPAPRVLEGLYPTRPTSRII